MSIAKPLQYLVIVVSSEGGGDPFELIEQEVQKYLDLGWVPCGSLTAVRCENLGRFSGEPYTTVAQAVTHAFGGPLLGEIG